MGNMIGHLYQTEQGVFCLDPRDLFVGKLLIETGKYGQAELDRMQALVSQQSSVLMIGTHIGALAVPFSRMVKEMVAIEANPDTYRMLDINLQLNRCSNVVSYNVAANDKECSMDFVMSVVNSGGAKRMPIHQDNMYFYDNPAVIKVKALPLDSLLAGKKYDLIFMDIEGSEYFAMKGMPLLLESAQVVITEFIPHHLSRVAGITVSQFLECLHDFQTLIIPSMKISVYTDMFHTVLQKMFESGQCDEGLIFVRRKVSVVF